ncbi:uncharacterized protein YegJ (DUF2314 family) [Variovorax boronicumulans]|uniref:DUF2314 domain-containing protein n=1 Tax=Variovorax boronicumulans TaxID=436515 RepID=UPI0027808390|nr:DUF2314 domain-containing protein [Variovorax boronicumulans]MDP9989808.1 uncharacterized protein YegJ (DUF2314 family) [Variovorax boronicumulans]MDQ0005704.1 uncharacterized protein YegJ (DUF2314 family) [Variovorax boronicumulans]
MPKLLHAPLFSAVLACFLSAFMAASAVAAPPGATPGEPVPAGSPVAAGPIHFQFAIYYPKRPAAEPLTSLRNRLAQISGSPKLVTAAPPPASLTEAIVLARWNTTTVQKDYRPPSTDLLQRFGRGLSREQAEALQRTEQALILDFAHPAPQARTALFKAIDVALQVARDGNGLLWDEETREVFTPDEWRKRRIDSWENGVPDVAMHTVIHAYRSDNLVRAITLGMSKLGLPDVVVSDFSWSSNRPMGNLVNVFAQAMVEGATIARAGQFDLDLRGLKHSGARDPQLRSLKPNAAPVAKLSLVNGKWESGDPQNRLFEIRFDRYKGPDRYAQQTALLTAIFGADEDAVTRLKHNDELLAASKAAGAQLAKLRDTFNKGLQPGEYILVKAPFTTREGGNEWMWVEIARWNGDTIEGLLKNEPVDVTGLHAGQMVKVSQAKLFDYIRRYPDGREEGNETGKIIGRQQGKK